MATAVYDTTTKGEDGWGTVTMYRDGEKVNTDSLGGKYEVTPEDGGSPLFVGGGSDDDLFDGAIGAVVVYPTAQSDEQIAARADVALAK